MGKRRQERMAEEIKRSLSSIIQHEIKDPRIDFSTVSVTRVDIPADISHARINISVLGDEVKQAETMKALQSARGHIRTELARMLQIRHAPELDFRLDKSIEHGIKMSSLLEELSKEAEEKKDHSDEKS
ncbi:Ribosome-binding factor A [Syntrophomonas zehnderi OL-4]|uniref:Ribosome-binding factor A n=1 Tax=Syntrophomonas zehnderi OL-4 TaxID=690567 RepID=A0A0E4GBY5_9FIRM|nr:30S ribosome-binding factor RbfA [Syntrophomonas zehnderi]CFX67685.1 Ribosome-binding factor A [Syntrophomonas zehnderi OL-4]